MKSRLLYLAVVLCMIFSLVPIAISANPIQAATSHVYSGQSIQIAINTAAAGDTIIVHDGTYNENIAIDKPLTILSDNGSATTIIDGTIGEDNPTVGIISDNVTFGNTGHGFKVTNVFYDNSDPDNPRSGMGIFIVNMDSGELSGITIRGNYIHDIGEGAGGNGPGIALGNMGTGILSGNDVSGNEVHNCSMGIALINMNASDIHGNTVTGNNVHLAAIPIALFNFIPGGEIYDNEISGNEVYEDSGFCIILSGFGGEIYENLISDNTIHDSFLGITLGEVAGFSGVSVHDNIIDGNEVYDCGAGIVLSIEGTGSVTGNTVKSNTVHNMSPIDTAPGHGISLSCSGNGTIIGNILDGNTVYDCNHGISILNMMGGGPPFTYFSSNDILNNITYCASLQEGNNCGIALTSCSDTEVHGNNIRYNSEQGLLIHASDNVDVTGNRVYNNSEGILLGQLAWNINIIGNDIRYNTGAPTTGINIDIPSMAAVADNININYNNIVGNAPWGVCSTWNYSEIANATNNWWGSSSGPGGVGPGTGDAVSANLSYTPWLTQELSQPPQMFYGRILTRPNGDSPFFNAPVGTVITAKVGGVQKGAFTVTTTGQYGTHPGTYLIIQGNIPEGATILFYVNGYQAIQTDTFESGAITQMNLNAELFTPTPTPTSTATPRPTPTPTASPTPTPTSTATSTPTPTPTASPTPTPTSTATPTLTSNPTPTPTVTSNPTTTPATTPTSAGQPNLTIEFQNKGNSGLGAMDDDGVLLTDITASSSDGTTTAKIAAGTQITDPAGQPVDEITMEAATTIPPVPGGYFLIEAFDFGPDGTIFSSALQITLAYDLSQLPADQEPVISYYYEATGEWRFIIGDVDTAAGTITFSIAHFTIYALMGHSATPVVYEGFAPWVWIVIGFTNLLSLVLIIGILMRRRYG